MNLLDIVVIAVFLWLVAAYYRRGFARAVFGFVSFWAAALLAGAFSPAAARMLRDVGVYEALYARACQAMDGGGELARLGAAYAAGAALNVLSTAVVFAALYAAMRLVGSALRVVSYIPVLGGINRLAGGLLGAVMAFALTTIAFAVIRMLSDAGIAENVGAMLARSLVARWLDQFNLFDVINHFLPPAEPWEAL